MMSRDPVDDVRDVPVRDVPRTQYLKRRSERQAAVEQYETLHARIAGVRFLLLIAGVWCAWAVFFAHAIAGYWLLALAIIFAGVVVYHHNAAQARARLAGSAVL